MVKILFFILLFSLSSSLHALPTLIHNVKGYTVNDGKLVKFDALLFEGEKIIAIGKVDELAKKVSFSIKVDGKGKTLLPGLIDSHGHILGLGSNLTRVDLRATESLAVAVKKVDDFAKKNPEKKWITGRGWNQVLWEGKAFPTRQDLDAINIKKPIYLSRVDGHAAWVNSKALELAKITAKTPDPKGGKILKDKNGKPTGILIDTAMSLVSSKIPAASALERQSAYEAAFDQLLSLGITSVHDAGISFDSYRDLLKFNDEKQLPIRVYAMLSGSDSALEAMLKLGKVDEPFLKIRSVKLFTDGALGSRGAALLEPYSDDPDNSGLLFHSDVDFKKKLKLITKYGFQVNTHAIGDKGNRQVLDSFETLHKKSSIKDARHRIEHAQIVALEDIPRLKSLHLIASMQPTHATSDMNMAEDRVGTERIKGAYAWRTMIDEGILLAAGSDFPVELANPFHGIFSAVFRQNHDYQPENGWHPEQAMSMKEALEAFTISGAYASFWESDIGSLEAGKNADFILIDTPIFKNEKPNKEIWKAQVVETWINGKRVYQQ